jgi:glycerophosphoryl diester phosphodiesterase
MSKSRIFLILLAIASVILSVMNASWIAAKPAGPLIVVAHRGVIQPVDPAGAGADACDARHIRASSQLFVENTLFSMQNAVRFGADALMVDVRASADGQAMIFRDATLDCRTNGHGALAGRPLAYLKTLDVAYGYSPDGGASFPLRGRGLAGMPVAEEVLRAFPNRRLIFALADPRAADAIVAAFARAGVAIGDLHGFAGDAPTLARLRALTPSGWTIDQAAGDACLAGYRRTGWLGLVPAGCRGTTVMLPRNGEWTLWGWPYRFMGRLQGAGARLFIAGDPGPGGALAGLTEADQLGEVPHDYAGMLLIEDMHGVGRALQR